MVGPSLFVLKFVLGDCFWCLFWGPFLDSVLVPVLGAQFWALLIRNNKHAPIVVPVLGPVLGPILGPILRTNLEFLCAWLLVLKLVVLGFRPPRDCQTFGKSNLFMSKIVFPQVVRRKRRRIPVEVFHSHGCKHALSCQALPLLRGYAHVVRGFLLFLGPNLGPRKRYAGEFAFLYTCDCLAAACWTRTCQPSWKAAESAAAY